MISLVGEGVSLSPTEGHPTADEITTLIDTARAANVSLEDFGHDMRRLMQLPDGQKITKKFLRETMTMSQYELARKEYGEQLRVILEEDVPNHEPPSATVNPDAPAHVPAASTETTPAVPPGLSSAPKPDPAAAREKLRQEALGWGIKESEVNYIIQHHGPNVARTMLWRARRPVGATLTESAAD